MIVTEGMLQYVPFDALPLPEQNSEEMSTSGDPFRDIRYVLDANEVLTLPSMLTLAVLRRAFTRD